MSITRFQTEGERATSEHVDGDTTFQLRTYEHRTQRSTANHTYFQLITTCRGGGKSLSSLGIQKLDIEKCARLRCGCRTQRPYEDVTFYGCKLNIGSMWSPRDWPENSFFRVEERQQMRIRHLTLRAGCRGRAERWRLGPALSPGDACAVWLTSSYEWE